MLIFNEERKDTLVKDTFAFLTKDRNGENHLYIVGETRTIIEVSSPYHGEYSYDSVEHGTPGKELTVHQFAEDISERVEKIYRTYESFDLVFQD